MAAMRFNQSIPVVSYKIDARYSLKTGDMLHGSYALQSINPCCFIQNWCAILPKDRGYVTWQRCTSFNPSCWSVQNGCAGLPIYRVYICYAAAMRCNQPIPADDPYRIDARDSLNTGDMLRSNCALQSINPCCFIQKGCAGLPKDKMLRSTRPPYICFNQSITVS